MPPLVVEFGEIEDSIAVHAATIGEQITHVASTTLESVDFMFFLDRYAVAESIRYPISEALQEGLRKWLVTCREELQAASKLGPGAKPEEENMLRLSHVLPSISSPAMQGQSSGGAVWEDMLLLDVLNGAERQGSAAVDADGQSAPLLFMDETGPASDLDLNSNDVWFNRQQGQSSPNYRH